MLPVLTKVFTPKDYGIIDLLDVTAGFAAVFAVAGLNASQTYFFYDKKLSNTDVIKTNLYFLLVWGGFLFALTYLFHPYLNNMFFDGEVRRILFLIALGAAFCSLLSNNFISIFRLLFRPWAYFIITNSNAIIRYVIVIMLVVYLHKGVTGFFTGNFLAFLSITAISAFLLREELSGTFSVEVLKKMLVFGVPLLPTDMALWLIRFSERYFLKHYISMDSVGIYAVGVRIASVVLLPTMAFRLAWTPMALSIREEPEAERFYRIIRLGYFCLISLGVIVLTGCSLLILKLMTQPAFYPAYQVTGFISYGLFFSGTYFISGLGCWLAEKTKYMAVAIVLSSFVSLILNILLIPRIGIIGAAMATCLAHISGNAIANYFGERVHSLGFKLKELLVISCGTLFFIYCQVLVLSLSVAPSHKALLILSIWLISLVYMLFLVIRKERLVLLRQVMRLTLKV